MSSSSGQEDDEDANGKGARLARRREAHTAAEQKRRDNIKKGYDSLQDLVPQCHQNEVSGYKPSKAVILQKSIDYIQYLQVAKVKQEKERDALRKEVTALKIMQTNYETMVRHQGSQETIHASAGRVSEAIKFQIFQNIMDELFVTFSNLPTRSFTELSSFAAIWLEEHCKPQKLRDLVIGVLKKFFSGQSNLVLPPSTGDGSMESEETFDDPMTGTPAAPLSTTGTLFSPNVAATSFGRSARQSPGFSAPSGSSTSFPLAFGSGGSGPVVFTSPSLPATARRFPRIPSSQFSVISGPLQTVQFQGVPATSQFVPQTQQMELQQYLQIQQDYEMLLQQQTPGSTAFRMPPPTPP